MNRNQTEVLGLLKEFDRLCKKSGIEYFVCGDTLLYSYCYHVLMPESYYAVTAMTAENARKFLKLLEGDMPADREIEYWGNSDCYPDYTIRYVNSSTTAFNILDWPDFKCHGFYIEIKILRSEKPASKHRKELALERGMTLDSNNVNTLKTTARSPGNLKRLGAYKAFCLAKGGRKGLRKSLFEHWMKAGKPHSTAKGVCGTYSYPLKPGKSVELSENHFRAAVYLEIHGETFPAPMYLKTLLATAYPGRFFPGMERDDADVSVMYFEHSVVDADVPYKEFFGDTSALKAEHKVARALKHKYDLQNRDNRKNKSTAADNWAIVRQTDARYRMAEYYAPLKADILKAYADSDFASLRKFMGPYLEELKNLESDGKVFAFDSDILDALLKMLEHYGEYGKVDYILRNMPDNHLTNAVIGKETEGSDD